LDFLGNFGPPISQGPRMSMSRSLRRATKSPPAVLEAPSFRGWNLETLLSTVDFLDTTNVGVILHDEQGVVLECNVTAAELFGSTTEGLVGRAFLDADWGVVHEDGTPYPSNDRPEMITLREGKSTTGTILGFDVVAKARRWLKVNTCLAEVEGVTVGVISSFIDITMQIQREHTMRLMSEVNRFAMTTSDETELLQLLCDQIVAFGDYSLAWIGEPSDCEAAWSTSVFPRVRPRIFTPTSSRRLPGRRMVLGPRVPRCVPAPRKWQTTSSTRSSISTGPPERQNLDSRRASRCPSPGWSTRRVVDLRSPPLRF